MIGLRPIWSRVALDVVAWAALGYCTFSPPHFYNLALLLGVALLTLSTAGITTRWTVSFPMVPLLALQLLRRSDFFSKGYAATAIAALSFLFLLSSIVVSVLFPAIEIPPVDGKYNVGVAEVHLPVTFSSGAEEHVTAKLYYPTHDKKIGWIPYLNPEYASMYCNEIMRWGAPPPLNKSGWLLHNWRLAQLRAKKNAKPLDESETKMPLVVHSHGLLGTSTVYSYQTMSLAANGMVVISLDHTDGSGPVVRRRDGSFVYLDESIHTGWKERIDHARQRREQCNHRIEEFLASAEALVKLNEANIPELEQVGVSFVNRLDTEELIFMGHSFGGATAIGAASRRPQLATLLISHEPAIDWTPDDGRRALFQGKLSGTSHEYEGGTGGYIDEKPEKNGEEKKESIEERKENSMILHDINMLFLYSEEWAEKDWGEVSKVIHMHKIGELGPRGGVSEVGVIKGIKHNEFSDTCMMTPLWLARDSGITGPRSPHETSKEIAARTLAFVEEYRKLKSTVA